MHGLHTAVQKEKVILVLGSGLLLPVPIVFWPMSIWHRECEGGTSHRATHDVPASLGSISEMEVALG